MGKPRLLRKTLRPISISWIWPPRANAAEGIRQGLEDARKGRSRPARDVLDEIQAKHGILR